MLSPRLSIVQVCHRLAASGFVAAFDGNVSARLDGRTILITAGNRNKGEITVEDIVDVALDGKPRQRGPVPSSELPMHLAIYRSRPDVHAVVHAHPPFATAFAVSGTQLTANVFPEVILSLGDIPLVPYATPSTEDVGKALMPFLDSSHAALLSNHGAVTWASTPDEAYWLMEKLEHTAHIEWLARSLGGVQKLPPDAVDTLKRIHPYSST